MFNHSARSHMSNTVTCGSYIYGDGDLQDFIERSMPKLLEFKAWTDSMNILLYRKKIK
jgi:hypothetical protein